MQLDKNKVEPEYRLIALSGKRGEGKFTKVSAHRYEYLSQFTWNVYGSGYAGRSKTKNGIKKVILIHREIMEFPDGMDIDHINGDKLDNRDENLRVATRSQNNANRHKKRKNTHSAYNGVTKDWKSGKWLAQTKINNKYIRIGTYEHEVDAARAYDGAALALFGEFAKLNCPNLEPIPFVPPKPQKRTSMYKGVGWSKDKNKWRAYRSDGKKMIHLGYFEIEEDAANKVIEVENELRNVLTL